MLWGYWFLALLAQWSVEMTIFLGTLVPCPCIRASYSVLVPPSYLVRSTSAHKRGDGEDASPSRGRCMDSGDWENGCNVHVEIDGQVDFTKSIMLSHRATGLQGHSHLSGLGGRCFLQATYST